MRQWSVDDVLSFLKGADLAGPSAAFYTNGVSGEDLEVMSRETLTVDLKMSGFAAAEVLAARGRFLQQP